MIWLFVLFILVFACALAGMFNEEKSGLLHFLTLLLACAGIIFTVVSLFGRVVPTIDDVPEKAHIDTVLTIHNNDTVYSYQIEWNDKK